MARYETIGFWEFQKRFSSEESCRDYLFHLRWPKGFVCPKCGGVGCYPLKGRKEYVCRQCHKQTSVTAGTVMHRSHLPLVKWFWAMYLMVTDKRGVSAKHLAAELDISYHSAWYLLRRLRSAMGERDEQYLLSGIVAMDETYYGAPGKRKHGCGTGKSSVLVALSKDEQGRPQYMRFCVADVTQKSIKSFLTKCVAPGSTIQTDGLNLYRKPLAEAGYSHQVFESKEDTDALKWVHTILVNAKAFIQGTYHGLGEKYLQEYLDEFTYRLNRRMRPKELFPQGLSLPLHLSTSWGWMIKSDSHIPEKPRTYRQQAQKISGIDQKAHPHNERNTDDDSREPTVYSVGHWLHQENGSPWMSLSLLGHDFYSKRLVIKLVLKN